MTQVAVIGLGRFGYKVASTLSSMGAEVIAIDTDGEIINAIKDRVHHAVEANASDEQVLRSLGISEVDTAVVAIGENMEVSIITTVILKRLGVNNVIARAVSPVHRQVLEAVGASRVVQIEEQMGVQIAKSIAASNVLEHMTFPAGYTLVEMEPPQHFVGHALHELHLRKEYGVLCVAIQRKRAALDEYGHSVMKTDVFATPDPDTRIQEHDIMVLVGANDDIEKIVEH